MMLSTKAKQVFLTISEQFDGDIEEFETNNTSLFFTEKLTFFGYDQS
jgi:hypothetical protein